MAATVRNTAIKRIQGDVREMMTNPSDQYAAAPLETNMFDWHFTLRGPRDTEFEGGIYHGRILLPSDYPFKPPNIILLTPNGRFEVRKKICLSISAYHPEEWQPAWGVRLILEALISFMPTKGEGAIGALDFPADERRRLAKLSVDYTCDVCGRVADLLPELDEAEEETEGSGSAKSKYADQIAQLHMHSLDGAAGAASRSDNSPAAQDGKPSAAQPSVAPDSAASPSAASSSSDAAQADAAAASDPTSDRDHQNVPATNVATPQETPEPVPAPAAEAVDRVPEPRHENEVPVPANVAIAISRDPDHVDVFLQYLTYALVVALFALVYKKMLQMHGVLQ